MAPIPGWVYVILGIVMILASQLIKDSEGTKPLLVFLYVGILFILIGIGKYIFRAVFKKKEIKPKKAAHREHKHSAHQAAHNRVDPQYQHSQAHHPQQHQTQNLQFPQQSSQTHPRPTHLQGQHEVHRASPQQHPPHMSIIACPACKTRHYDYARYCMRCGTKIKRH